MSVRRKVSSRSRCPTVTSSRSKVEAVASEEHGLQLVSQVVGVVHPSWSSEDAPSSAVPGR